MPNQLNKPETIMTISTKQSLYCVKFRRGGFTVRQGKDLYYESAVAAMRRLRGRGIAAYIECQ